MSRYSLLGNDTKDIEGGRSFISITTLIAILFGCLGFGYALTAYFAQPAQNLRIDNLDYKIIQVANNLTNETTARIDKDMILMYNISELSMDIDYIYTALNMTNVSGVFIVGNLIYLNQSVTNLTGDVNNIYALLNQTNNTGVFIINNLLYLNQSVININNEILNIYGLLNQTNSSISSLITDVAILNNSVAVLLNNVSALEAKTLIAGTGITILDQNSNSYGTIYLSNISGVAGAHPYPISVTVDEQGRITNIIDGVAPMTSVTVGPGLSVIQMNPSVSGGTLNSTSTYLQLQTLHTVLTPATYASIMYDQYGRIVFAMDGTPPVLSVSPGIGMNFTAINSGNQMGTIDLSNVGTPGTYVHPSSITTDAQGRVSAITPGSTPISSISAGTGMSFTTIDSTNPSGSISLSNIPLVAGAWTNPSLSVDGQGRITSIANGTSGGSGTVTSITAGAGLTATPNPITTSGTISMPSVGPGANTYYPSSIDLDAQGRVVSFGNTPYFTKVIYLTPQTYPGASTDYELVIAVGGVTDNPIGYAIIDPGWHMLCYTLTRTQTASTPAGLAYLRSDSQFEPPIPINNNLYTYCSNADGAGSFCTHHSCGLLQISSPNYIPILMYRSPNAVVLNPDGRSFLSIVKL